MNNTDRDYLLQRTKQQNDDFARNYWRVPPEPRKGLPLWVYIVAIGWCYGLWLAFS